MAEQQPTTLEQQEALANLLEISCGTLDVEKARTLLASCNWNVQHALAVVVPEAEYSDNVEAGHGSNDPLPAASSGSSAPNGEPHPPHWWLLWLDSVRQYIRNQAARVSQILLAWLRAITRPLSTRLHILPHFDFDAFFADTYGAPKPEFFSLPFAEAARIAIEKHRLLVVYLHHTQAREGDSICQHVLKNEVVIDLLANSAVVWGSMATNWQALALRRYVLGCRRYPHLSVFAPAGLAGVQRLAPSDASANEPLLPNYGVRGMLEPHLDGFVRVACLEGPIFDPSDFLVTLTEAATAVASASAQVQWQRQSQLESDRKLREEQDRAYEAALKRDTERAQAQLEAERVAEEARRKDAAKKSRLQAKADALAALRAKRDEAAISYLNQCVAQNLDQEKLRKSKIRVRLPAGVCLERDFAPTSRIKELFIWLDLLGLLSRLRGSDERGTQSLIKSARTLIQKNTDFEVAPLVGKLTPDDAAFDVPIEFYLSTSFPVKKFTRAGDENDLLDSSMIFFLHEITPGESDTAESSA